MDERIGRAAGALTVVGAALSVVASVPSRWYGVARTGAYVFDPPVLSPLWVERVLMPVVGLVGGGLLVAGLAALVVRDRRVAGRLRRWGGTVAVAGLLVVDVSAFVVSLLSGNTEALGALVLLLVLLVAVVALGAGLLGLVLAGVGYARTERPTVGYALVGGAVLSVLAVGANAVADVEYVGSVPVVLPFALSFLAVADDLWTHHEPLPDAETETGGDVNDDADEGTAADGAAAGDADDGRTLENAEGEPDPGSDDDGNLRVEQFEDDDG